MFLILSDFFVHFSWSDNFLSTVHRAFFHGRTTRTIKSVLRVLLVQPWLVLGNYNIACKLDRRGSVSTFIPSLLKTYNQKKQQAFQKLIFSFNILQYISVTDSPSLGASYIFQDSLHLLKTLFLFDMVISSFTSNENIFRLIKNIKYNNFQIATTR